MIEEPQGSEAWIKARLGKVTASRVADVIARTKTGWGTSRANYMAELIAERLTGEPADSYVNAAMQRGIEMEPEASAAYAFRKDVEITEVGFIQHPKIIMAGASPDSLVGTDGLIEVKCPNVATHIDTLLGEPTPAKYVTQMMFQLACTGRQWCDFVSYDPRLPEAMRLFVQRVSRDDNRIAELEIEVCKFLTELDEKMAELSMWYKL